MDHIRCLGDAPDVGMKRDADAIERNAGETLFGERHSSFPLIIIFVPREHGTYARLRTNPNLAGVAVQQHVRAVADTAGDLGDADHIGDAERARQDGGMAGLATLFGDDPDQVVAVHEQEIRGQQLLCNQYRSLRQASERSLAALGESAQQPASQIPDVVNALSQVLIVGYGERADELFDCGFYRLLSVLEVAADALLDPLCELRISKEREVGGEDFRLGATDLEGCASLQLLQPFGCAPDGTLESGAFLVDLTARDGIARSRGSVRLVEKCVPVSESRRSDSSASDKHDSEATLGSLNTQVPNGPRTLFA